MLTRRMVLLVNVTADMNFDESEVNIELFNPIGKDGKKAEPVIRSEKVSSEKYSNKELGHFGTGGAQQLTLERLMSKIHSQR